jgi:SsrA-binding protein
MILVKNKRARRDYELEQTFQAGVVLEGREVKSLRQKQGSLKEAYIKIIDGEAYLINAQINPYTYARNEDYDPTRSRKLLLRKREIATLNQANRKKNRTIVPLSFEVVGKRIKLNLAIGRGKKEYEKRRQLKRKAQQRDAEREIKQRVRF